MRALAMLWRRGDASDMPVERFDSIAEQGRVVLERTDDTANLVYMSRTVVENKTAPSGLLISLLRRI